MFPYVPKYVPMQKNICIGTYFCNLGELDFFVAAELSLDSVDLFMPLICDTYEFEDSFNQIFLKNVLNLYLLQRNCNVSECL